MGFVNLNFFDYYIIAAGINSANNICDVTKNIPIVANLNGETIGKEGVSNIGFLGNIAGKLNAGTGKISMERWKIAERAVTIENDDIFRGVWIIICMAIMAFGTL